jgi:hypothetical protein
MSELQNHLLKTHHIMATSTIIGLLTLYSTKNDLRMQGGLLLPEPFIYFLYYISSIVLFLDSFACIKVKSEKDKESSPAR